MLDSFIRVGAATPEVKVADTVFNATRIIEAAKKAADRDCGILVFPELSITGYTFRRLFWMPLRTRSSGSYPRLKTLTLSS